MGRTKPSLRFLKENLRVARVNKHLAINDSSLTPSGRKKAMLYHDRRISDYETRIERFGKAKLIEVKGKLYSGKDFTIYLCNVEEDELSEVLSEFKYIDHSNPLKLRTIETKTILL